MQPGDQLNEVENDTKNLYTSDEYIRKNPSLHEEDSEWKVEKLIPFVKAFIQENSKESVNLLDVGGGAGVVLSETSSYIEKNTGVRVNKYAVDLSPGMLQIQKKRNPTARTLNEDIRYTSLNDREIDLTLLIDVLEHVPDPVKALKEIKRISRYAILKVPLDGYLLGTVWNFINSGKPKRKRIEGIGHINTYRYNDLKNQVESNGGKILSASFTNVSEYHLNSPLYRRQLNIPKKLMLNLAVGMHKFSPWWSGLIFHDYAMFLVKY